MANKKRVVIVGGGHAGFRAAKRLLKLRKPSDNLEIIVASSENCEVYHGFMPQIVGGNIEARHALVPLRHFLPGIEFYNYPVDRIDLANRKVFLNPGGEHARIGIVYDYLVIALGSVTDLSRFPGLLEHGLQTKTIGDVFHLRDHLIDMLERASVETDVEERRRLLTFVVAGAGFAGIEIGSEANGLIRSALRFYPSIQPSEIQFTIISNSNRILPAISEGLAAKAANYLQRTGVKLRLGTAISSASAGAVVLSNGESIQSRSIIVTVGVAPNPVISNLPIEMDRGRIKCDQFCRVPGQSGVYAIGDNAAVPHHKTGEACPATAMYAFTQGVCSAENIIAELRGNALRKYRFSSFAEVAVLSKTWGLVQLFGMPLSGFLASVLVRATFFMLIPNWRSRCALLLDWFSAFAFPPDIAQMKISRSDMVVPLRFAAGQEIIRQGEPGSRFYIVTEGKVEVVRRTGEREDILATLGPGKYFGEIALLRDTDRTATVRAIDDTKVLSIARQDFKTLIKNLPILAHSISETARMAMGEASQANLDYK